MYIEDIAPMPIAPSFNEFLGLVAKGEAKLVLNLVSLRVFAWNEKRYFLRWQSDSVQCNTKGDWIVCNVQDEIPN